jgi:glycosyltransferase involved in cell wall biosynthesis
MTKPKLIYLVTADWYFCSHRLPIAREAKRRGYDVMVATHVDRHREQILDEGFGLIPLKMRRCGTEVFEELSSVLEVIGIYRRERPDIVHHVAMKPMLYGSFAAKIAGVPRVVNAPTGLGFVFVSLRPKARLLRMVIGSGFKMFLSRQGSRLIIQNRDDRSMFIRSRFIREDLIRMIRGSGVDTDVFRPAHRQCSPPVIALVSRMLWDKGVGEFVGAAQLLKNRGVEGRFVLVGDSDSENPNGVPRPALMEWDRQRAIEWWGRRDNMAETYGQVSIACLPSYREGLPKSLLEAAACGLPIVTTDVPGCREVVRQGENGLLVPVKSTVELADALQALIENQELREKMGIRGREIALNEFAEKKVVDQTMAVYGELFGR